MEFPPANDGASSLEGSEKKVSQTQENWKIAYNLGNL
jgi:hypothetical protein